jgi:hypothetical protein
MKHQALVFALVILLGSAAGLCAQEGMTAAQCYVAGDQAWTAGRIDDAISLWTQALKLKPDSSLTKDRLIEALRKKVDDLTKQLAQAQPQLATPSTTVVLHGTPNPDAPPVGVTPSTPPGPTIAADAATMTPEAIAAGLVSIDRSDVTSVQREAARNKYQNIRVHWTGVLQDITPVSRNHYDVSLLCGDSTVTASVMIIDRQAMSLKPGQSLTITGIEKCTGTTPAGGGHKAHGSFTLTNAYAR